MLNIPFWSFIFLLVVFTEYDVFSDASLDVNCVNDYDSEMACTMTSESSNDCSEYKLSVSLDTQQPQMFACGFQHIHSSTCVCKFQVPSFVVGETFTAALLREGNILFTKDIKTMESIKPKRPIIKSVHLTENGNFLITWDTNYTQKGPFSEGLSAVLTYSVKGSSENKTEISEKGQTKCEILGRKLLPYSNYIIWARVVTDYNNNYSDYSEAYLFSTPSSLQDTLKIIIPISCVILIFFISTIYYCYIKIVQEWWEKIPVPKIVSTFEKKVPYFPSFLNEFSTVSLDNSKLDHTDDKIWQSNSDMDISSDHSQHSLVQDGDLSQVIYGQTGNESMDKIDAKCMLCKEDQAENLRMAISDHILKDLQANNMSSDMLMDCGNSSGSSFNNRCYLGSASVGSSFRDQPIRCPVHCQDDSEDLISAISQNLEPLIPTDFEYGPCNGCSGSTDTSLTQVPPSSSDFDVIFGYQSTSEVLDCGKKPETDASANQAFIISHNNVNHILELALFNSNHKEGLPPACESIIIPVGNGHPASQSSHRNPGEKWSADRSTELQQSIFQPAAGTSCHSMSWSSQQAPAPSLEGLCRSVLHIPPSIQIDYSYQKV